MIWYCLGAVSYLPRNQIWRPVSVFPTGIENVLLPAKTCREKKSFRLVLDESSIQCSCFGVKNYTAWFHASKNKTGPCFTLHAYSGQGVCFCFFAGKQLQNTNESYHAWPWNCAWLMLTLETQLNSSVLNQNGALWLGDLDPRSPQARLTASCCSALDLWQQTKVLFLFSSAFINPQISPPPLLLPWQKLLLFLPLNWMRAHLKRRSSTILRVCRPLLERMIRRGDVYKMSVLGLGELIWVKKSCVAVVVDILGGLTQQS